MLETIIINLKYQLHLREKNSLKLNFNEKLALTTGNIA